MGIFAQLVDPAELWRGEERLEAVEGSPDREAEIQFPQVTTLVHEQVGVLLGQQVFKGTHLPHQGEEIGVIEKEHVQPHFDVVAAVINPAAHLAAHERASLIEIHLMPGIHQVHRSGEARETGTDNRDPHLVVCN